MKEDFDQFKFASASASSLNDSYRATVRPHGTTANGANPGSKPVSSQSIILAKAANNPEDS